MGDKPDVFELKGMSFEKESGESTDDDIENEEEEEDEKSIPNETDVGYPEEVVEEHEQETDVEMPEDKYKDDPESKELVGELEISEKFDNKADFTSLKTNDTVLIDTPLEGAKVGKVIDLDEAWTGSLEAKVDTGANEYVVTPFDDEYSTSFVGKVSDTMDLGQDVLGLLERKTAPNVSEGADVVIDVPEIGPTRAMVEDVVDTKNQGKRITLKSGDVRFVVFEEPSPQQTKEQPYIVGEFR